jgi:DNA polymerase-3 subunit beta
MPILGNFYLQLKGDDLSVFASDLEISAATTLKVKGEKDGETTIGAKVFTDLLKEFPAEPLSVDVSSDEVMTLQGEVVKAKLVGRSALEYPKVDAFLETANNKISADDLLEALTLSVYASSTDESKFLVNALCFRGVSSPKEPTRFHGYRCICTDSSRLAMVTKNTGGLEIPPSFIIPKRGVNELRRFLNDELGAMVGFGVKEPYLIVESNNSKLCIRLVAGEYPEVEYGVPTEEGDMAIIEIQPLLRALRRASLLIPDKHKAIRFKLESNSLQIFSQSSAIGEVFDELSVEYLGPSYDFGLNATYLLDAASAFSDVEKIILEFFGDNGPIKLYPEGNETALGIIMPMRL